ncbi:Oidioi.mRNA.OKI2018_I69.XSR.g15167.t1.cds [Oikopleura dioica]|uniref:Oidioi.mRNA.OKI2018_I69.XSR.g15167.t1.cds n=1 Tax=Oikopleura dioica TaxID=34765 RepID=A0ABN7SC07_OIKDI|nr:Oidioi.mRNA.OKI2018_I69.XSR.g15167.t1.cds [Oikopleura dioica]
MKIRRKVAAPAVCAAVCVGGFCNTNLNILANQDYTWGYGSILCGAFLCYLITRIGVEDVRVDFLNKISAEIKDYKVPKDDPEPEPEPSPPQQDGSTIENPKYEVSDLPTYEEVTRSPVTLNPT